MSKVFTISDALISLLPGIQWSMYGSDYSTIVWHEEVDNTPTLEQLEQEILRLQQEYDSKLYQRQRQVEYPPLSELADALYWQNKGDTTKMQDYLAKCELVKQKYPKGASNA